MFVPDYDFHMDVLDGALFLKGHHFDLTEIIYD